MFLGKGNSMLSEKILILQHYSLYLHTIKLISLNIYMKRMNFWSVALFSSLIAFSQPSLVKADTLDPVEYVNPMMGSESTFELSTGNTYPATARPWGMNFWTPQTGKMGDGWQYQYTATKINGFKQTHQPSPWINDYGQFSIMPIVGAPEFDMQKRASWFSHKGEVSSSKRG